MECYDDMDSDLFWDDDFLMDLDDEVPFDFDQAANSNLSQQNHQEPVEMKIQEQDEEPEADSRADAIEGIESLVISFLSQLSLSLPPVHNSDDEDEEVDQDAPICMKTKTQKIELQLADRKKITSNGSMGIRSLRYPQKAKPFAQLFRVLDLTHEALVTDIPATKRDIYYKDVPLFRKQAVVDRLVDDLAATFELERSDLNIRATSKGLVCGGGLIMHLMGDEIVYTNDSEGALIPVGEDISRFEVDDDIAWVLIVEKEAVFQTLCRLKLAIHPSLPGPGIVITGKGYPDIATRQLVKTLSDNLPSHIPILALVDGDAYGLDILSVYKHGSMSLRHENEKLAASRVEWLGVWASELTQLNIDQDALIPITKHDEKKAHSMLSRDASKMPPKWRKELLHMLHNRRKAEIEIISTAKVKSQARHAEVLLSRHVMDGPVQQMTRLPASPLLDYLLDKISDFVDAYADT